MRIDNSTVLPWKLENHEIKCLPDEEDTGTTICEMFSSRSPEETRRNGHLFVVARELKYLVQNSISLTTTLENILTGALSNDDVCEALGSDAKRLKEIIPYLRGHAMMSESVISQSEGNELPDINPYFKDEAVNS